MARLLDGNDMVIQAMRARQNHDFFSFTMLSLEANTRYAGIDIFVSDFISLRIFVLNASLDSFTHKNLFCPFKIFGSQRSLSTL